MSCILSPLSEDAASLCWAMYLRRFYSLVSIQARHQTWGVVRAATGRFSTALPKLAPRSPEDSQPNRQHQRSDESQNHGEKSQRLGPIRPITLFAICVPMGYALNWALKEQKDVNEGASADGFVKYTLARKDDISSTCSIFTISPSTSSPIDVDDPDFDRVITSIQFKQPQLQICRNYTLLPRINGQNSQDLRVLIRRERNGEVSGYLHRLPVGAEIEVRGVFPEYKMPPQVAQAVFLAGGTGISPAMQGADILAGEADVHILWASRRREDCIGGISDGGKAAPRHWSLWSWWHSEPVAIPSKPLEKSPIVSELDLLRQRAESPKSRLLVDYFVDEEGSFIQPSDVQRLLQHPSSRSGGRRILFVSGPDGFINHWAAPKQWKDGREVQGQLGGILSTLDLTGWEVVKL